jgi:hypothetical protein
MAVVVVVDVSPEHRIHVESKPPRHDFAWATCICGWEYGGDAGRTATQAEMHLQLPEPYLRFDVVRAWL